MDAPSTIYTHSSGMLGASSSLLWPPSGTLQPRQGHPKPLPAQNYGLAGYAGGKHQGGWGTQNYIIPLGAGYIEIAAVFDEEAAQGNDWGRYVMLESDQL